MSDYQRLPYDAPVEVIREGVKLCETPSDRYFKFGRMFVPQRILEIGCYWGASAVALLHGAYPIAREIALVDVDMEVLAATIDAIAEIFHGEVTIYSCRGTSVAHGTHEWVRAQAEECGPFDLAHIDGEHTYHAAHNDLRLCWSVLAPGGVVIGHDTHSGDPNHHDMGRAWDEFAAEFRDQVAWRWDFEDHPGMTLLGKGIWTTSL